MTDTAELTDILQRDGDRGVRQRLANGDRPLDVQQRGNQRVAAWGMDEFVERTGCAPMLPQTSKGIVPLAGAPFRTENNVAFVIVTGKANGDRIEISRDLMAPARLAAIDLGTMPGNPIRENFWYNNMVQNRPLVAVGTPIQHNRFKGQPVIIAGAGPSLEKHVDILNDCEFPVIVTNRALKMLDPRGKFYLSIDYLGNEEWFEGIDTSETEAIFDVLSAHVGVNREWKARRWFRQTYDKGPSNAKARQWYPRLPLLDPGHCVAYGALGLALWWGADPILFTGQDFSFGSDKTLHAGEGKDSIYEQQRTYQLDDLWGNVTTSNDLYISAAQHVQASVQLSRVYGSMWHGNVPRFVNCSEQGIFKIPDRMPLADALELCRSDLASMQGTPVLRLPRQLINPKAKLRTNAKKKWIYDTVFRSDKYWSTEYRGPEEAELVDTGVVKAKDEHGRDVILSTAVYAALERDADGKPIIVV